MRRERRPARCADADGEATRRRPHAREPRAHRRRLRELLTTQPLANVLEVVIVAAFGRFPTDWRRRAHLEGGGGELSELLLAVTVVAPHHLLRGERRQTAARASLIAVSVSASAPAPASTVALQLLLLPAAPPSTADEEQNQQQQSRGSRRGQSPGGKTPSPAPPVFIQRRHRVAAADADDALGTPETRSSFAGDAGGTNEPASTRRRRIPNLVETLPSAATHTSSAAPSSRRSREA